MKKRGIVPLMVGRYTLVDEILKYRLYPSVDAVYYKTIYEKLLDYARENGIMELAYSENLPYEDKENWIMLNELLDRKKHEHYSSFMSRVYNMAKSIKRERNMLREYNERRRKL